MAEQLFCKQLVVSSNLTVGSMGSCRSGQSELAVNQSGFALRRFESFTAHRCDCTIMQSIATLSRHPCDYSYTYGHDRAHVAQSVEHILGKNEVIGSIPIVGSGDEVPGAAGLVTG